MIILIRTHLFRTQLWWEKKVSALENEDPSKMYRGCVLPELLVNPGQVISLFLVTPDRHDGHKDSVRQMQRPVVTLLASRWFRVHTRLQK